MWTDEQKDQVRGLLTRFCDAAEVCAVMDCSADDLDGLARDAFGADFKATMDRFAAQGRALLKKAQFDLAVNGDRGMLQVLGREQLGQESTVYKPKKAERPEPTDADEVRRENKAALKVLQSRYAPRAAGE